MPFITQNTLQTLPRLLWSTKAKRSWLNRLALDRHCWPSVRSAARMALTLPVFAQPLSDLSPEWEAKEVDFPPPIGFSACNPSVVVHQDRLFLSVRTVNYLVEKGTPRFTDGTDYHASRNFLLELSRDGRTTQSVTEITYPAEGLTTSKYRGLEDIRLSSFRDELWGSFTVLDRHPSGIFQLAVSKIALDGRCGEITIQGFEGYRNQKNWMPFVLHDSRGWICMCDPTLALKYDEVTGQAREWMRWRPGAALDHQRGGSQLIPWNDGWLCLTHEMTQRMERFYLHRFLQLDREFSVIAASEPFYLHRFGIEFCAGLCRSLDSEELLVSFGVKDRVAMLGRLPERSVHKLLHPISPSTELPKPHS